MKIYTYDKQALKYKKLTKRDFFINGLLLISVLMLLLLLSFWIGRIMTKDELKNSFTTVNTMSAPEWIIVPENASENDTISITKLILAMIEVESNGNNNAINPVSGASGCLQLLPIMVQEVNNIPSKTNSNKQYNLEDRFDRIKSIQMFNIWRIYHHSNSTWETIARNWNGGPNGYKMSATVHYWNKIKRYL